MPTAVQQLQIDWSGQSFQPYESPVPIALLHLAQEIDAIPGGASLSINDGTHTVAAVATLSITGGTVGGTTPNATLAIIGSLDISNSGSALGTFTTLDALSGATFSDEGGGVAGLTVPLAVSVVTDGTTAVNPAITLTFDSAAFAITDGGSGNAQVASTASGSAPPGTSALIASAIGVDLNTAGDTAMTLSAFATGKSYVIEEVLVKNASTALDTVTVGVFSGAAASGQKYMNSGSAPSTLTTEDDWATFYGDNTASPNNGTGTLQSTPPIVNVGTPQGSAATADFYVYGRVFA